MRYVRLRFGSFILTAATLGWAAVGPTFTNARVEREAGVARQPRLARLETVALRVHRLDAMVAFYTEAFEARFREVNAGGIKSQFGQVGELTVKLVPIRKAVDFEGFPVHQLGFNVRNVDAVVAAAIRFGGRLEGELTRNEKLIHAAIRDPDGNTIELYQIR